jgi:hypothetical protein
MPDAVIRHVENWSLFGVDMQALFKLFDMDHQGGQRFADCIRQAVMLQVWAADFLAGLAAHQDLPRHTDNHRVRRYWLDDNGIGADPAVGANRDCA